MFKKVFKKFKNVFKNVLKKSTKVFKKFLYNYHSNEQNQQLSVGRCLRYDYTTEDVYRSGLLRYFDAMSKVSTTYNFSILIYGVVV